MIIYFIRLITKLTLSEEDNIALHFSTKPNAFIKSAEIGDGIYVWTNTSTQSKLSVLSRLFALYDEDPAGLVFYLRDESELTTDEPGSRHELQPMARFHAEWSKKFYDVIVPFIIET